MSKDAKASEPLDKDVWALFAQWHKGLPAIISAQQKVNFPQRLMRLLSSLVPVDEPIQITISDDANPPYMLSEIPLEKAHKAPFSEYLNTYVFLDPCYRAFREQNFTGYYDFAKLAPQGFFVSEVYLRFYKQNYSDEIGYVFAIGDQGYANLSVARSDGRVFSNTEKKFCRTIGPFVISLLQNHLSGFSQFSTQHVIGRGRAKPQKLELMLENFGSNIFSTKEYEVMQLILRGYSVKAIAERLNRSVDTIKKHHRSIYQKLDINSQREILPLLIGTLELSEKYEEGDSLEMYLNS